MRRGDPERIYLAQRAGFVAGVVSRHEATRERVTAVLGALEAECDVAAVVAGDAEGAVQPADLRHPRKRPRTLPV